MSSMLAVKCVQKGATVTLMVVLRWTMHVCCAKQAYILLRKVKEVSVKANVVQESLEKLLVNLLN